VATRCLGKKCRWHPWRCRACVVPPCVRCDGMRSVREDGGGGGRRRRYDAGMSNWQVKRIWGGGGYWVGRNYTRHATTMYNPPPHTHTHTRARTHARTHAHRNVRVEPAQRLVMQPRRVSLHQLQAVEEREAYVTIVGFIFRPEFEHPTQRCRWNLDVRACMR
jgi:hypothetical protein